MVKLRTRYLLLLLSFGCMQLSFAQISQGGDPLSKTAIDKNTVIQYELARPDQKAINQAIAQNDRDGGYPVIARSMSANISLTNSGTWTSLANGGRVWKAKLHAEEAQGLIVGFTSFYLPEGAKLFLYSDGFKEVMGAYTSENNHSSEQFTVGIIQGDAVTVEYFEPANVLTQGRFTISEVGYVFRMASPAFETELRNFGDSDPCQVNVNCTPESTGFANQKRGVVRILVKEGVNFGWCSGSVVNNTANNCIPYVLLALHCGVGSSIADMNQWVFYFNYEAPTCTNPATQGTLANQSMTGCTRRSDSNDGGGNTGSDYLLVQINANIPAAYNVYYNGWNRSTTATAGGKGIHHPSGDIKKISTYTATPVSSQWNGNGVQSHWRVNWVATTNGHGVTEGGSSGSPMFNSTGLIVGTLTGGSSYCSSPTSPDYYGKMSYHWNGNTAPTGGHLSTWLDPGNTGVMSLNGTFAPCGPTPPVCSFTPSATSIQAGQTITFTDNSTNATGWNWNFGGGATPNTSTAQNPTNIAFNTPGTYTVTLIATNPSGSCTTTVAITVAAQTGCDTINFLPPGTLTVYTAGAGSYVCGWNTFADISKAELIGPHAPYTHVNSVLVYFYGVVSATPGATVNFRIWNNAGAGGSPGAQLASVDIPLSAIAGLLTGTPLQGVIQVDFPTAINVGAANFYIGISMTNFGAGDQLGMVSNTNGNTVPGTAWEQQSTPAVAWYPMSDATNSWGVNLTQFICPLMTNLPPTSNLTATPTTVCTGGSVTFNGTSSVNESGYNWTFIGGSPATSTSATPTVTYNTAGTYKAYLEVDGVCAGYDVDSITITVNNIPNVTATPTTPSICAGGSGVTLTAAGGTTYSWSPATGLSGTTGATVTANPTTTTTYTVVGTTSGCSDPANVTVTVNPVPTISVTPSSATICTGGSGTTLTASGGTTYTWSPATGLSATTGATVTANPTTTTTYTVTGTTAGCSSSTTVTITVNTTPTVNKTPTAPTICTGGSGVSITASGATTYSWSPATGLSATTGATVTANPTTTTTYTISGTTAGCTGTTTVTVTVNTTPTISVTPSAPTICAGGNTSLTASGGTTYSWSPATGLSGTTGATVTASPGSTQTYTVTGTTSGCSNTANVTVTVTPLPTISVSPAGPTICQGNNTSLTASGGTTYSWSPATGLSATTGATVTASPTSTQTYTVTGTTSGCSNTANVTVTVTPTPVISVTPPNPGICTGGNVTITASGATTYSWSPATGLSGTTGATVTSTPASTITYTVTGTQSGCTGTGTVTVTVAPSLTINVSPASPTICSGGSTTLTATGGTTYTWSPGTGLSSTTGAVVTANPTSTQTYTVTGTSGSCSGSTTVTVTVNPTPTTGVTPTSAAICAGANTTLTASGATTYSWSPATGLSGTTGATVTASPTSTQTYTVTGTTAGCSSTATSTITVTPLPSVSVTPSAVSICAGANTTLTASGATTYSWSPATGLSATTGATVTANPSSTQTYTVTGTTAGCDGTGTATVTVTPLPSVSVSPAAVTICAGNSTPLTASGATTYSWSPATGLSSTTGATVTASPSSTQTYTVTGTTAGCDGTGTSTVTVNALPTPSVSQTGNVLTCNPAGSSYQWYISTDGGATWNIIAGETNQTLTITQTAMYYVDMTDANGCTGSATGVTANYNAVPELSNLWNLVIHPNPNSGLFEVELKVGVAGDYQLEITDAAGRLVYSSNSTFVQKETRYTVDISKEQRGTYFLKLNTDQKTVAVKRIVKM